MIANYQPSAGPAPMNRAGLDKAVCLSACNTAESSGCGIPARIDAGQFSESRIGKSADESRSTDSWSASYGQRDVS